MNEYMIRVTINGIRSSIKRWATSHARALDAAERIVLNRVHEGWFGPP